MKKPLALRLLALILLIGLTSLSVHSANQSDSLAISQAKSLIVQLRELADIPGIAVAVGTKEGIVWEEGFGLSDLENNIFASPKTRFRIGSVSKIITIAAAMRLVERGIVDVDTPISKYDSDLPAQYGKLTIRLLAGHLAGVRHYKLEDTAHDLKHFDSVKDSLKIFTGDPLLHEPGTKYFYSTFGYILLSAAMEAASGKEFLKIVDEEVLQPLKMSHSGPDLLREIIPQRTRYYERAQGKITNAHFEDPSYKWSAGGMTASAGDLVHFGMAHLRPGYLKKETLEKMFSSQRTSDGKETGVGLGWRIGSDWQGRKIYHHAGNIAGGRAVLVLYPEQEFAIAVLTNVSSQPAFVESTAQLIAESFLTQTNYKAVPRDLAGLYELSGTSQDKPYSARLEIKRTQENYHGSIKGDFPLLKAAETNGLPAKLSIASVWTKQNAPILILVSPFGLVEMILTPNEKGYRYSVDEGPAKFEGQMTKIPS